MSKEGDKADVIRSTKVRTKLKGDCSWLQRRGEPEEEKTEEKPWLAEVRAGRANGVPTETSPVSSPTKPTPPPTNSEPQKAPTSGYMFRGVFTKVDKPDPPKKPLLVNGPSGTTQFTKKPSETYKKIAPYTVKPSLEKQENTLSPEEQEKRTEAASNVLRKSAARQRSYVLSAAKKYESKAEDSPPVNNTVAFVAKRVEITDDDESAATPAPASSTPRSPVAPTTSVATAPQPKPRKTADTSVKTPVDVAIIKPLAPKVEEKVATPEPAKEDPAPVSVDVPVRPKVEEIVAALEHAKEDPTPVSVDLPVRPKVGEIVANLEHAEEDPTPLSVDLPVGPKVGEIVANLEHAEEEPAPVSVNLPVGPKVEGLVAPLEHAEEDPTPASVDLPVGPKVGEMVAALELVKEDPTPVSVKKLDVAEVEKDVPVPAPTNEDPAPVSVPEKDPFEGMKPGCTKVATPLPVLLPQFIQAVSTESETGDTKPTSQDETSLVDLTPTPESPTPLSPPAVPLSPIPLSPTPAPAVPLSPVKVSAVTEITVKSEPEPEPEPEPSPKPGSSVDTLSALSNTLISFNTTSSSVRNDEPELAEEKGGSADSHTSEDGDEEEPTPEMSNCIPITDDLLPLTDSPEEGAEPIPLSPGRWSQDLLSGLDRESNPTKPYGTVDLLADDVIVSHTEVRSLSTQPEEEKPTDETAKETQSSTETVTVTTKTVIITDKSEEDGADPWSSHVKTTTVTTSSSADPFDPYPIGTTSPNSSSDLLQPLSDTSINRVSATFTESKDPSPRTLTSSNALESLADEVIPNNTEATSTSTRRSWTRTWESSTTRQTYTEKSEEAKPEGQAEDQNMMVMFERKSKENDSPWDRWTSPTVYTIPGQDEEEEEEEESPEDTQTQTVTTITTIREMHSEPEPAMDRYDTYSRTVRTVREEEQRVQTPEPETKKGFVYVKEYVNATETSLYNARDTADGVSDYFTSRSANYSYSSPSSGSLSSTCNYCGKQVGNDARISIEHLNVNCHPACFKCGVCGKPMGDLLYSMFLHDGKVHCESCYSKALD
ncbi:zinc finger protein 185 [Cheilinus undulatus]|uniref:zinc finger protein 185 n=1 Tax=Cheilinus undulatus TaxID=241271 RepID=UPI001BD65422|nr:zinc finger protein 185 [Cheilinus undulatus]